MLHWSYHCKIASNQSGQLQESMGATFLRGSKLLLPDRKAGSKIRFGVAKLLCSLTISGITSKSHQCVRLAFQCVIPMIENLDEIMAITLGINPVAFATAATVNF